MVVAAAGLRWLCRWQKGVTADGTKISLMDERVIGVGDLHPTLFGVEELHGAPHGLHAYNHRVTSSAVPNGCHFFEASFYLEYRR